MIKKNNDNCKIKMLEFIIDGKLNEIKQLKSFSVTNKDIFELKLLKAELISKVARSNERSIDFITVSFLLSIIGLIIFNLYSDVVAQSIYVILLVIISIVSYFYYSRQFRNLAEQQTHILELFELLIEKKNKVD